jgi:FkbM family methyltransferase
MWNAVQRAAEILGNRSRFGRGELLGPYLRLKAKRKLVQWFPRLRPESDSVLGYRVATGDYTTLAFLFEEIFVRQEYVFATDTQRPVVVDCGSNIGVSLLLFKKLYPECRIVAFEPDPETFAILKRNVEANGLRDVELHNVALDARSGRARLHVDPEHPAGLRMSTRRASPDGTALEVGCAPLSEYISGEVDFLKMDIEGAEAAVIGELAARDKLRKIKQMVIEYHHHIEPWEDRLGGILGTLETHGFGYQIRTAGERANLPGSYQDILIYAYRH